MTKNIQCYQCQIENIANTPAAVTVQQKPSAMNFSNPKIFLSAIFLLANYVTAFHFARHTPPTHGKCSMITMRHDDQGPKRSESYSTAAYFKTITNVALSAVCSMALFGTSVSLNVVPARAESGISGPVTVLGSNGKTGKMIVKYLSTQGVAVRPTSYRISNSNAFEGLAGVESVAIGDVTKIETLEPVLKGSKAVIFAASASSKGGKADKVDYLGVVNVANECVRLKVPRLVVISSGAVTRPDSLGFKITNLFGGIMDYKLKGEMGLKVAYANADPSVSYVIIRPGGLLDSVAVGPGNVELNQGDSISGEVNREDVAQAAAAAAISVSMPNAVTFEMNEAGRSAPLEGKFAKVSGYERNGLVLGADYEKLFAGLKSGEVVVLAEKK